MQKTEMKKQTQFAPPYVEAKRRSRCTSGKKQSQFDDQQQKANSYSAKQTQFRPSPAPLSRI
jgi:hypothetical protein